MAWKEEFALDSAKCPACGSLYNRAEWPAFDADLVTFECACAECGERWVETYRIEARDGNGGEHVGFE